jgi:hypothetical protein
VLGASTFLNICFIGSLLMLFVCRDAFVKYWVDSNMLTLDVATQIFNILKQPDCKYLTQVHYAILLFSMHLLNILNLASWQLLYSNNNFSWTNYHFYFDHISLISNLFFENFWQLIQGWNSYRILLNFKKDMVSISLISVLF